MDLSQYADLFLAESREHVSACNELLLALERDPSARDPVSGIFRAMHTVKGMAATMGYARVAELAHTAESLLDGIRSSAAPVSPEVLQLLFRAVDALESSIGLAVAGRERDADLDAVLRDLALASGKGKGGEEKGKREAGSGTPDADPSPRVPEPARTLKPAGRLVRVALRETAPLKGGRALIALRYAGALGTVRAVSPPTETFESEDFDGHFAFRLETPASIADVVQAIERAGDVESVDVAADEPAAPRPESQTAAPGSEAGRARHLRVDLRRLDALMDLIGELVIVRGRLNELAVARRDPAIDDIALGVARLSRDLQDQIIQARLTPVWQVFDRFPRLVRDSARQLGKQVQFRVEGKEIELDRTILDELGDPLVHMLRNAVDHGIEPPEERRRAGKKPEGEIVLAAVRERSSVIITISDDGRGIPRRKVLERAKREGLVDPHAENLTDDQLLRIIARPGFTTTESVTAVSGRGVGIDVAVTRLRALGGSVEVRSDEGRGTTFVLRLPVTLAIVRALIASVGRERYALPLTYVSETIELGSAPTTTLEGREAIVLRDRVVPLVHLRRLLAVGDGDVPPRRPIIVLEMGERRAGLVVDSMLGQQEIVVKGFDAPRGTLPLFSGATIMGDGVPALILDAGGLV
ncbi:MAG TPA: chemotaxis protein CheA [Gemmatimonadales bacterium]|nr:chemotaxis protein CheA [Gemmatimonadales bacterium]